MKFRSTTSRLLAAVSAMLLLASGISLVAFRADAAGCGTSILTIVAHPDDDLLFMNPDIQNDIRAGACATTIFVTAGDAGLTASYWAGREAGVEAAYNTMLGVASTTQWTPTQRVYGGRSIATATSPGGQATFVFLRLPDGGLSGTGNASTGYQSLARLWGGDIPSIQAVDQSNSYTESALVATLSAVRQSVSPSKVRVQNADPSAADHSDHLSSGRLAQLSLAGFGGTVNAYRGYDAVNLPANVSGADLTRKTTALLSYGAYDPQMCDASSPCPDDTTTARLARQYTAPVFGAFTPVPGPAPYNGPNLARNASILASSQVTGQEATKAIDSIISGWPANGLAEWSSNGQRTGAWLQLYWPTPQTIDRVYLYDRPNLNDQITAGTLTFSDGTTIPIGTLE